MQPTRVCATCEDLLVETFDSVRHHLKEMRTGLDLARDDHLSDEQRRIFTALLVETFNEAQSAWDAYRKHLAEHGLP